MTWYCDTLPMADANADLSVAAAVRTSTNENTKNRNTWQPKINCMVFAN